MLVLGSVNDHVVFVAIREFSSRDRPFFNIPWRIHGIEILIPHEWLTLMVQVGQISPPVIHGSYGFGVVLVDRCPMFFSCSLTLLACPLFEEALSGFQGSLKLWRNWMESCLEWKAFYVAYEFLELVMVQQKEENCAVKNGDCMRSASKVKVVLRKQQLDKSSSRCLRKKRQRLL